MKTKYILAALSAFVTIVGCDKVNSEPDSDVVKFNVSYPGASTKATSSAFEAGDAIGVYMTLSDCPLQVSGNEANNIKVSYDGTSWSASPKMYWEKDKVYDVYGYYPYSKPSSVDEYRFSVQTDQDSEESAEGLGGYEASDFLWAQSTGVKYPDVVSLSFKHCMSSIVVNLVKGEDFSGDIPSDAEVYVLDTGTDALIDLSSGVIVKDRHSATRTVKAKKISDTQFTAIIVPQRIETRIPLFEVVTSGVSYLVDARFVFKQGVQHVVNVTLSSDPGQAKIDIGGEIGGWE